MHIPDPCPPCLHRRLPPPPAPAIAAHVAPQSTPSRVSPSTRAPDSWPESSAIMRAGVVLLDESALCRDNPFGRRGMCFHVDHECWELQGRPRAVLLKHAPVCYDHTLCRVCCACDYPHRLRPSDRDAHHDPGTGAAWSSPAPLPTAATSSHGWPQSMSPSPSPWQFTSNMIQSPPREASRLESSVRDASNSLQVSPHAQCTPGPAHLSAGPRQYLDDTHHDHERASLRRVLFTEPSNTQPQPAASSSVSARDAAYVTGDTPRSVAPTSVFSESSYAYDQPPLPPAAAAAAAASAQRSASPSLSDASVPTQRSAVVSSSVISGSSDVHDQPQRIEPSPPAPVHADVFEPFDESRNDEHTVVSTTTVYVATSGRGQCYHSRESCPGLRTALGVSSTPLEQARGKGYRECSKCY